MPEDQNVWGEQWNGRLNNFLADVLNWTQLGDSNVDIFCPALKRKVGLDSVFAYKRNPRSTQQVVFVEAKSTERIENINRSKIETWIIDFVDKIAGLPFSQDFTQKFAPDTDAIYNRGLLALWVRDETSYSSEKIRNWLSQINLPTRRQNPIDIIFISNKQIAQLCAIHAKINELKSSDDFIRLSYFFPIHGNEIPADGSCIPIEILLSKFVFCKTIKRQNLIGSNSHNEYESYLVFYLGDIKEYADLRFVGLALNQFQIFGSAEVDIFTKYDPTEIRNDIANYKKEFAQYSDSYNFRQLKFPDSLPDWLFT